MLTPAQPTAQPSPIDRQRWAWITQRGAEIAALLAAKHPAAHYLGEALLADLRDIYREDFPARAAVHAAAAQARDARRQERSRQFATEGPALWETIHRRAWAWDGQQPRQEQQWLQSVSAQLPNGDCQCRQHYQTWLTSHPPALTDAAAYFAWTVDLHNAVNARLGKPEITVAAARTRWAS